MEASSVLVLTRKKDESLRIDEEIIVTIIDVKGDKVRLGVHAPSEIPVHREEVYQAIKRESRGDD
jgi:carbon storage regulator